jgi:hypothetical protein
MDKFTEKIKYFKCRSFFPQYCGIKYHSFTKQQLAGKNWRGNPAAFSTEQKKQIIAGIEKLIDELKENA